MLRVILCTLSTIAVMSAVAFALEPGDITYMTEQYAPYNFEENGRLKGVVTDTVRQIMARMAVDRPIKLLPWARGYHRLLNEPNTCLFSMTLTKERRPLFKWVGPVAITRINLVKLGENRDITISGLEDVNKFRVGVIRADIGEQLLVNSGKIDPTIIEATDRTILNIRKLVMGRIDLICYGDAPLAWEIIQNGYAPERFETVYQLSEGQLFIAFHKDTPEAVIESFQRTLDGLKADGTYQRIVDSYIK